MQNLHLSAESGQNRTALKGRTIDRSVVTRPTQSTSNKAPHTTNDRGKMTQVSIQDIWHEYQRTKSPDIRRTLAAQYVGIVRFVVSKFSSFSRQSFSLINEDDLTQIGMIGLLDSIERYDPSRGVKFETYAITRIRGTVQDELRKLDWIPRSVREKVKAVDRVTQKIECSDGSTGMAGTIAAELSISIDKYLEIMQEVQSVRAVSGVDNQNETLDTLPDDNPDPSEHLGNDEMKQMITSIVEELPPQDRLVISLYYYEELTFKEIASVLKLSESRIFQKHAAILKRLREHVSELV